MSARKLGVLVTAPCKVAVLDAGRLVRAHEYVSGSLSASHEALPSRNTITPTATPWFTPATATGGVLVVVMTTVAG